MDGEGRFFSIKITEEPEAATRENLQIQDLVSPSFNIPPSEHQDLNWSQAGGSLGSRVGTSIIRVVLDKTRNRHMDNASKKAKCQKNV